MNPFFTIITPTLQRESLVRCTQSVLEQTFTQWEILIQVDAEQINQELFDRLHPTRNIRSYICGERHGNFGNRCRHLVWEHATGEYLIHLDDDNAMYRPDALADIAEALKSDNYPDFALFPIHRHGSIFLMLPPGLCRTDTANVVVKREIGRWPDIEAREADGHWVEALRNNYAYTAFPDMQPIILMEKSSNGV